MDDFNKEALLMLAKFISRFLRSNKILNAVEEFYPFDRDSIEELKRIIDKESKEFMIEDKEVEKELVESFLNLLKEVVSQEVVYKIYKDFNDYYEQDNLQGFIKEIKNYKKSIKKEAKVEAKYKNELFKLLNREEEFNREKSELISIIEVFLDSLKHFLETDELLRQKLKNLKEDIKSLDNIESIKRFKLEVKDLFLKLGLIERILDEERKELKNIILLLAESLKEFLGNSNGFSQYLDTFIEKIKKTDDIDEIKKLKLEVIKTTMIVKENTEKIKKKLLIAEKGLKEVKEKMNKLEEEIKKAKEKALYDGLTGAYTRAVFNDRIVKEVERAKREKKKLSLLMMDIDKFKIINDTYGHQMGDMVLKIIVSQIKKVIRDFDFLARYGGEEFVLILPETGIELAKEIGERIRSKIEHTKFLYRGERIPVTISIGCTELQENDNVESFIERADKALYEAKNSGRNRVVVK